MQFIASPHKTLQSIGEESRCFSRSWVQRAEAQILRSQQWHQLPHLSFHRCSLFPSVHRMVENHLEGKESDSGECSHQSVKFTVQACAQQRPYPKGSVLIPKAKTTLFGQLEDRKAHVTVSDTSQKLGKVSTCQCC